MFFGGIIFTITFVVYFILMKTILSDVTLLWYPAELLNKLVYPVYEWIWRLITWEGGENLFLGMILLITTALIETFMIGAILGLTYSLITNFSYKTD